MEPLNMIELAEMKRIYSAVEHLFPNSKQICLVVTSASRQEGKTTVAGGLAAIIAQRTRKRVLAADLNWHTPALHSLFKLSLLSNYKDILAGEPITGSAQPSSIQNLDILTGPKVQPDSNAEWGDLAVLSAQVMRAARKDYEVVIVDTSSVFPTNRYMIDPVALSKEADATLMVVLADVTSRQVVKRAKVKLETSGATIAGVIVNQWKNPLL